MDYKTEMIQRAIVERQSELHNIAGILSEAAEKKIKVANWTKVLTILLGAFVATQAVAGKVLGEQSSMVAVVYALAGLFVAVLGGIEAAFKHDAKGAELAVLAARCQSAIWQIDSEWSKTVGTAEGEQQYQAARVLLDRQDASIADIQSRAAQAGVNITLEVRGLWGDEPRALA